MEAQAASALATLKLSTAGADNATAKISELASTVARLELELSARDETSSDGDEALRQLEEEVASYRERNATLEAKLAEAEAAEAAEVAEVREEADRLRASLEAREAELAEARRAAEEAAAVAGVQLTTTFTTQSTSSSSSLSLSARLDAALTLGAEQLAALADLAGLLDDVEEGNCEKARRASGRCATRATRKRRRIREMACAEACRGEELAAHLAWCRA